MACTPDIYISKDLLRLQQVFQQEKEDFGNILLLAGQEVENLKKQVKPPFSDENLRLLIAKLHLLQCAISKPKYTLASITLLLGTLRKNAEDTLHLRESFAASRSAALTAQPAAAAAAPAPKVRILTGEESLPENAEDILRAALKNAGLTF